MNRRKFCGPERDNGGKGHIGTWYGLYGTYHTYVVPTICKGGAGRGGR